MTKRKWNLDDERDIWRAICAPDRWFSPEGNTITHPQSLWWFVCLAWGTEFYFKKHPEQPRWLVSHIHGPYLEWLQYHILYWKKASREGSTDRHYLATILPRGFGKTVMTTKSAMIWCHLDEPDMSTLIASSTTDLATDIYKAIQSVLAGEDEDSWFSWLYGNWKKGSKEWNRSNMHHGYRQSKNISEPSFDVTSIDTGMTGYHHRIHNWDDPIFANKLREGREAYMRAVHTAVNASYNALQTNGLLMLTLTRYIDDDVAGRHLRFEGVKTWAGMDCPNTMMFDKVPIGEGIWHVYFFQTEDELTGEPTHPILYDKAKIAQHKRRDPEDFACQQQNNPGSGERAPILESQISDLYMDYKDFAYNVPIEAATVHLDTAFKTIQTVRTGDDSAIVTWLHDARRNGIVYLDTDLLRASDEWREENFNDEFIKVLLNLRRRVIRVKAITDEMEKGGKAGSYKNRILALVYAAGLTIGVENFRQFNRTTDKKARIRSALGYWVEGYVRILLHKDTTGHWIIPPIVRKLFNQVLRIDTVEHEDIADASVDVFIPGIWYRPYRPTGLLDDGSTPISPGDEALKEFTRPLTNEELYALIDENKEVQRTMGPGHGWDEDYEFTMPRDPV